MDSSKPPRRARHAGHNKPAPPASQPNQIDPSAEQPAAPAQPVATEPAIDDARQKKIARIKQALEDGTYRVSNEDVARKLIEHMLEPKE